MKKIIKKLGLVSLLVAMFLPNVLFASLTYADDSNTGSGDITKTTGFTYSLNFPENQMEKDIGYYKLQMSKGQEQKITVTLTNPSAEKVTVTIGLNGAVTNQNGVIEYGDSDIENDKSLKFDFEDIVSGPESISLDAGETKDLELKIKMPETGIEGVVAGGIQLMRANQEDDVTNKGGSRIINQYAYVIGLLLQESSEELSPDLKLNKVFAGQANYRNTIFVDFSNVIPAFLNDMTVETQINKKGSDAVLFERKQTAMRMAPNSFIQFPVSMNGERMVSGTYVANTLVTSGDKKWTWTEEFKISQEEANKFNERDVGLVQEKGFNWLLVILIVGSILALGGIIFGVLTVLRKKKQKKELEEKRSRKKKKGGQSNEKKENKRPRDE